MKKAIANIWLLGLVTLFIFLFAGYLAVTLNYSKTFKVKNEILTIIEKQHGFVDKSTPTTKSSLISNGSVYSDVGSLQVISLYLHGSGDKTLGSCDMETEVNAGGYGWYGVSNLGVPDSSGGLVSPVVEKAVKGKRYYYCFASVNNEKHGSDSHVVNYSLSFKIQLFYRIDLPVVGDFTVFRVEGTTAQIFNPACGYSAYCSATYNPSTKKYTCPSGYTRTGTRCYKS